MNERIKLLAEQAGGEFYTGFLGSPNSIKFKESDLEKFAQFIVEQCAGIIESQDVDPSFKLRMSWAVKQHFGVEK